MTNKLSEAIALYDGYGDGLNEHARELLQAAKTVEMLEALPKNLPWAIIFNPNQGDGAEDVGYTVIVRREDEQFPHRINNITLPQALRAASDKIGEQK